MREYRILTKGTRYYPQVRERKYRFIIRGIPLFLHISEWQRISRGREIGFDLFDGDDFVFGEKSLTDAEAVLMDYEAQFIETDPPSVLHHYSESLLRLKIHQKNRPVYKIPKELLKESSNQKA